MQCCWKSLLGLFGQPNGLGCHPILYLSSSHYIFAERMVFSDSHFYVLSNAGTIVIIEILADVYAAKVKNATSTLTSKH